MDLWEFHNFAAHVKLTNGSDGDQFIRIVEEMMVMLNETDSLDLFGTEGWKHQVGLD